MTAQFFDNLVYNEQSVAVKVMLETPFTKEIRILFKKGQSMKEHQTDFPITVHVLKGEIEFGVSGEKHILKAGDLIALGPSTPHDLFANDESIVRLTLSKSDSVDRVFKVIR